MPRYPLGAPTDDGFNFPPADDSFLSTPPASPREGETVTPPHTPHDLLRRDVLRAVSWDEGSPSWFGENYAPGGRPRAVSLGHSTDYSPWPARGDAAWVPFDDGRGALVWHKGYVVTAGGSLLQVSFSARDVETVAAHTARREPPLGARTHAAADRTDDFSGGGGYPGRRLLPGSHVLGKRKAPDSPKQPKEKKHGRKNGALSEARWAAEREKSRDPTMPEKRPVGISLASGSSSGWRLRISGTQLGHYATAQQAWAAYPRDVPRKGAGGAPPSHVVDDDDED